MTDQHIKLLIQIVIESEISTLRKFKLGEISQSVIWFTYICMNYNLK